MLRRFSWILLVFLLTACTLAPEQQPAPTIINPTCPPAPTCAVCPTAAACPANTLAAPADTATPAPVETLAPLPTVTATLPPVDTLAASPTPVATLPAETAAPSPTAVPTLAPAIYSIQPGTPRLLQNFARPEQACAWMGVAGQVFGADRKPLANMVLVVKGTINGVAVESIGLTGTAPAYGEGGYEISLADQPLLTEGVFTIQLFDLDGNALSSAAPFDTAADCKKNLILINFAVSSNQPVS